MRAAVTPEPRGAIAVGEVPDPDRRAGEVLVKVHAASVNRLDRAVYEGTAMGGVARFPLIQGIDAAGVIEQGSGSLATGLRVVMKPTIACRRCRECRRMHTADCVDATTFGIHRQGGFAELVSVPRSNLVLLPESLTFAEGAAAAHTHAVVLRMIRSAGDVGPEPRMLVTGAGGALGTGAVQLGSALGHRVIATASSDAKLETAGAIGASMVANRKALGAGFVDAIRAATDGLGVDVVIETTGAPDVIADALAVLARGGALVLVASLPGANLDVDVLSLYRNRQRIIGSAGSNHDDFSDVFRLLAEHEIHPVISAVYPLDEAQRAMDAVTDRNRIGKVVLEVEAGA